MSLSKDEKAIRLGLPDDPEIQAEYWRLMKLLGEAPQNKRELARKIVSRAAFYSIMLDRLEKDILTEGYDEEYRNGLNQLGRKKSPAAELHVTYTKNLLSAIKQINDLMGWRVLESGDAFDKF